MTQVQKVRAGKWNHQMATAEEMAAKVEEIREIVTKYGWLDTKIAPYGFGVRIEEFLGWFKDYDRCTASSKHLHISEINGFIEILNHWLEREAEPKVTIRFLTGKKAGQTKEIPASDVEAYVEIGFAEIV